jgi:hypothetical protein
MSSCVSACQNTTQEYVDRSLRRVLRPTSNTEQEDKCMSLKKILSIDKRAGGLNFWQGPRGYEPEVPSLV